jgi:hypothetical protein
MSSSLRQTINKTMKRKRGGFNFASRALKSMSNVVSSGNSTPKPLSDEEIKEKKEQETKEIEEKQTQCASKNEKIKETLEKNGIISYSNKESKTMTELNPSDSVNKRNERLTGALTLAAAAGALVPFAGQFFTLARVALLGINKYQKDKELSYLSSDCLSYISNITKDIAVMNAFYSNNIVKEQNIVRNATLYDILQKNVFKFLYFLIDNINFTADNLGAVQYSFWVSFLKQIDFSDKNYDKFLSPNSYRYSCAECITDELRKLLQDPGSNDYQKVINLNTNKDSFLTRYSKVPSRRPKTEISNVFCDEEMLINCRNNNDIIMRLIEYNMYKLIKTTYKNRFASYKKFKLSQGKENYLFDHIFDLDNKEPRDINEVKESVMTNEADEGEVSIYLDFLFELKRIMTELNYEVPKSDPSSMSRIASASGINSIVAVGSAYVGTALTRYNEMLREYIIMTGNFGTITSRYAIDYNSLSSLSLEEKKKIEDDIKQKTGKISSAIVEIIEENKNLVNNANQAADAAAGLTLENSGLSQILESTGGRQKQSKKLKIKRNKSKRNFNNL